MKKTADQQRAMKLLISGAGNILLFGGSRSGKTFILVYALLVRALRAGGSRHMILRFRGNSVWQSVRMDTFNKVVKLAFPGLRYHESVSDGVITLPNHSEIWFGGLDNQERSDRILGREFATIYFNECSEISYESVNTALTRLAQKTELANRAYFDCNPSGKSHWSYKLFMNKIDPLTNTAIGRPDNYVSMLMNPEGNRENLAKGYIDGVLSALSERQRRRFLYGEWLSDNPGALWNYLMLNQLRVVELPSELERIVVGVDPAVSSNENSDYTGIVVSALGADGNFYVLEDGSIKASPNEWCARAVRIYHKYQADCLVGEVNNGGELIESLLRTFDDNLSYRSVRASRGKIARAEVISALYEQKKVYHVGAFPELEEQMCSYDPKSSNYSPDRLDALVWSLHELAFSRHSGFIFA